MLQGALYQIGVAKQTAKGTAATNPTYAHGVMDGGFQLQPEQARVAVTSGTRVAPQVDRTKAIAKVSFTTRMFTKSTGLWLLGGLGSDSVTGAGPYTHTITGANALPYLTVWAWLDSQVVSVRDFVVDSIEISWDGSTPPSMKIDGAGTIATFGATFTPTTDDTRGSYLLTAGGSFKVDTTTSTPVVAPITKGSVKLSNNSGEVMVSGTVVPNEYFPGVREWEIDATLVPTDVSDWRKIVTGASGGTTVTETPQYGSSEFNFIDGTSSLKIATPRTAFAADFPNAIAGGGPALVELSGLTVLPSSGAELTHTLINGIATY
jgi:hypothetical protein